MLLAEKQIKETNVLYCLECGKCSGTCPVARYSESFSPRMLLIRSTRNSSEKISFNGDLWSCLTCKQCDEVCPWDIKYGDFIQVVREAVGSDSFEGTCSHGAILQSISQIMTSDKLKQNRLDWVSKDIRTSKSGEYLFFVGCLPYFESLFDDIESHPIKIAQNSLKILNHFGIEPQLLADEKCCGHDYYWQGDIESFQKLARLNIEQLKDSGATKIITACPECYRTLKLDYPRQMETGMPDVQHISEFLSDMIRQKQLELKEDNQVVTFQDPCRLGRHMGIYDAPRNVIQSIEGIDLREMAHHHKRSVCCGVSGWMNCSRVSKQIQAERLQEANATGAKTLITSCAKCKIHFDCALQDQNLSKSIDFKIMDLTEFVIDHLH